MQLKRRSHFQRSISAIALIAFANAAFSPAAMAYGPSNGGVDVMGPSPLHASDPTPPRKKKIDVPVSDRLGYIIIRNDKVVCGASGKGQLSIPKCDDPKVTAAYPEALALAQKEPPQYAMVHAHGGEHKQAGLPIAILVAGVTCAGAGYIGASLEAQQNTILTQDATETVQAAIFSVSGTATALKPAKEIVRLAVKNPAAMGLVTRVAAVSTIAGAICFASAGAGYGIYQFFFRKRSDVGPPAK